MTPRRQRPARHRQTPGKHGLARQGERLRLPFVQSAAHSVQEGCSREGFLPRGSPVTSLRVRAQDRPRWGQRRLRAKHRPSWQTPSSSVAVVLPTSTQRGGDSRRLLDGGWHAESPYSGRPPKRGTEQLLIFSSKMPLRFSYARTPPTSFGMTSIGRTARSGHGRRVRCTLRRRELEMRPVATVTTCTSFDRARCRSGAGASSSGCLRVNASVLAHGSDFVWFGRSEALD